MSENYEEQPILEHDIFSSTPPLLFVSQPLPQRFEEETFRIPSKNHLHLFPEEFTVRGLLWSDALFPESRSTKSHAPQKEDYLQLESMTTERIERIIWLTYRKASMEISQFRYHIRYTLDSKRYFYTLPHWIQYSAYVTGFNLQLSSKQRPIQNRTKAYI